jgi:hypothetical protein
VEFPTHEQLTARLNAFTADALDELRRSYPDGFDVGVMALVYEVLTQREGGVHLKRIEAGYTPPDDVTGWFGYWCSDHRQWVQEKLFEDAYDIAQHMPSEYEPADGDDETATE